MFTINRPRPLSSDELGGLGPLLRNALQSYVAIQQARRETAKANMPFGGEMLPGASGQVLGLELMRQAYGENSPQYQKAAAAFNLSQDSTRSRIGYQDALMKSMPIRYTTPQGRSFIEQSNVNQGTSPAGTPVGAPVAPWQPPYAPPSQQTNTPEGQNYQTKRLNENIPTFVKQKLAFATNIEKTLDSIDPDALTSYAGIFGTIEKGAQTLLNPIGLESKNYDKYTVSTNAANALATQVRQFYGDSIQPEMIARLEALVDPATWKNNPKLAKEIFYSTKNILQKELNTYRDMAEGEYGLNTNKNNKSYQEGGVQSVNLSGFKSQREFQEWYQNQPPDVKAQVQKQLGGR